MAPRVVFAGAEAAASSDAVLAGLVKDEAESGSTTRFSQRALREQRGTDVFSGEGRAVAVDLSSVIEDCGISVKGSTCTVHNNAHHQPMPATDEKAKGRQQLAPVVSARAWPLPARNAGELKSVSMVEAAGAMDQVAYGGAGNFLSGQRAEVKVEKGLSIVTNGNVDLPHSHEIEKVNIIFADSSSEKLDVRGAHDLRTESGAGECNKIIAYGQCVGQERTALPSQHEALRYMPDYLTVGGANLGRQEANLGNADAVTVTLAAASKDQKQIDFGGNSPSARPSAQDETRSEDDGSKTVRGSRGNKLVRLQRRAGEMDREKRGECGGKESSGARDLDISTVDDGSYRRGQSLSVGGASLVGQTTVTSDTLDVPRSPARLPQQNPLWPGSLVKEARQAVAGSIEMVLATNGRQHPKGMASRKRIGDAQAGDSQTNLDSLDHPDTKKTKFDHEVCGAGRCSGDSEDSDKAAVIKPIFAPGRADRLEGKQKDIDKCWPSQVDKAAAKDTLLPQSTALSTMGGPNKTRLEDEVRVDENPAKACMPDLVFMSKGQGCAEGPLSRFTTELVGQGLLDEIESESEEDASKGELIVRSKNVISCQASCNIAPARQSRSFAIHANSHSKAAVGADEACSEPQRQTQNLSKKHEVFSEADRTGGHTKRYGGCQVASEEIGPGRKRTKVEVVLEGSKSCGLATAADRSPSSVSCMEVIMQMPASPSLTNSPAAATAASASATPSAEPPGPQSPLPPRFSDNSVVGTDVMSVNILSSAAATTQTNFVIESKVDWVAAAESAASNELTPFETARSCDRHVEPYTLGASKWCSSSITHGEVELHSGTFEMQSQDAGQDSRANDRAGLSAEAGPQCHCLVTVDEAVPALTEPQACISEPKPATASQLSSCVLRPMQDYLRLSLCSGNSALPADAPPTTLDGTEIAHAQERGKDMHSEVQHKVRPPELPLPTSSSQPWREDRNGQATVCDSAQWRADGVLSGYGQATALPLRADNGHGSPAASHLPPRFSRVWSPAQPSVGTHPHSRVWLPGAAGATGDHGIKGEAGAGDIRKGSSFNCDSSRSECVEQRLAAWHSVGEFPKAQHEERHGPWRTGWQKPAASLQPAGCATVRTATQLKHTCRSKHTAPSVQSKRYCARCLSCGVLCMEALNARKLLH